MEDDVIEAINDQFDMKIMHTTVKSLRKAYGGTKSVLFSLPVAIGKKLLAAGKVRIGWTVCRISEKVYPAKCFKC